MQDIVRTIRLYGKLGARFGRVHRLAVHNAPEAVRALSEQIPGFRAAFASGTFSVFLGKRNLKEDELDDIPGGEDIRIAPMVHGRKSGGLFTMVLGAALLVAGVFVTGGLGTALMIGGAATVVAGAMMGKTAMPKGLGTQDKSESRPSDVFNGAVNVQAQGNCVPLVYGRLIAGSAVGQAGIYPEDKQ